MVRHTSKAEWVELVFRWRTNNWVVYMILDMLVTLDQLKMYFYLTLILNQPAHLHHKQWKIFQSSPGLSSTRSSPCYIMP